MNNIFESTEPIEEWMDKHFPELWNQFKCHCIVFTGSNKDARYFAMSFQCQMREWLHQHDHSKEVEIRALYDELHSLKQQEPKASEVLSEKLERLDKDWDTVCLERGMETDDWIVICNNMQGPRISYYGATPLEAVQALEEQLKEGS